MTTMRTRNAGGSGGSRTSTMFGAGARPALRAREDYGLPSQIVGDNVPTSPISGGAVGASVTISAGEYQRLTSLEAFAPPEQQTAQPQPQRAAAPPRATLQGVHDQLAQLPNSIAAAIAQAMGQAPAGQAPATAPAPPTAPQLSRPAAPLAPTVPVAPTTSHGLVDPFHMTHEQLDRLGPEGVREAFDAALKVGRQQQGFFPKPMRPPPPVPIRARSGER